MTFQRSGFSVLTILIVALALFGCEGGPAGPGKCEPRSHPGPFVLVVNGLSETLDIVDADTPAADACPLELGEFPNDVAVDSSGRRALVVDSGDNDLLVVDLEPRVRVGRRIDLGVGTNPWAVVWRGDDRAFVSLLLTGEVVEVDLSSGIAISRVPVGAAPEPLLLSGDRLLVGVTNYSFPAGFGPGEVVVIDAAASEVCRRIPVGVNPQHIALAPDGRVHVVCTGDYGTAPGRIYVLDADAETVVDSIEIGGTPLSVAINSSGKAYVGAADGGLLAYDATTLALLAPLGAPIVSTAGIFDVALDASGSRLLVADFDDDALYLLDTTADTVTATLTVGDGPVALAFRPREE